MLISLHLLEEASRESYLNYCVLEKSVEGDFPAQEMCPLKAYSKNRNIMFWIMKYNAVKLL